MNLLLFKLGTSCHSWKKRDPLRHLPTPAIVEALADQRSCIWTKIEYYTNPRIPTAIKTMDVKIYSHHFLPLGFNHRNWGKNGISMVVEAQGKVLCVYQAWQVIKKNIKSMQVVSITFLKKILVARIVDIACGEANLWLLNRMNIKMYQQILKVFKS